MPGQPILFGIESRAAEQEGAEDWSAAGLQISPPVPVVVRFHMTGTLNPDGSQTLHEKRLAIDCSDAALGADVEVH